MLKNYSIFFVWWRYLGDRSPGHKSGVFSASCHFLANLLTGFGNLWTFLTLYLGILIFLAIFGVFSVFQFSLKN